MARLLSNVNWVRVLLAVIAAHLLNVLLVVALVIVASLLAAGTGSRVLSEAPIDQLAGRVATWGIPVLTALAAAWAARDAAQPAAVLHGSLVGLLVALVFGTTFFWPSDPANLVLFALIIAAGFLGGLVGARFPGRGERKP